MSELIIFIQVLETTSRRKVLKNEIKYQRTGENWCSKYVILFICIAYKNHLVATHFSKANNDYDLKVYMSMILSFCPKTVKRLASNFLNGTLKDIQTYN